MNKSSPSKEIEGVGILGKLTVLFPFYYTIGLLLRDHGKGRLVLALLAVIDTEDTSYIWNRAYSGYAWSVSFT